MPTYLHKIMILEGGKSSVLHIVFEDIWIVGSCVASLLY